MLHTWRTARIFISSTFRDMQAERDHLVRFVFPSLREALLPRRIHLVDVDLRWGVTSEQDALQACLNIVDECRPHFLCMLGGRYGWIPPGQTTSITQQEIQYGALDRPDERAHHLFFFREPAATQAMVEATPGAYREAAGSEAEKLLTQLKAAVSQAGYAPFIYPCRWDTAQNRLVDLEIFGQQVYDGLLASIEQAYETEISHPSDEFAEEDEAIEVFVETRTAGYVVGERRAVLDALHAHALGEEVEGSSALCLIGAPGSGKSALLSFFYTELLRRLQDQPTLAFPPILIAHMVGASPASTDARLMLRRICSLLKSSAHLEDPIPDSYDDLRAACRDYLRLAAERGHRIIILIDAINQLDPLTNIPPHRWLPDDLPPSVRWIVTTLPDDGLDLLRRRAQPPREYILEPLSEADSNTIIDRFLERYNKQFEVTQRTALLAKMDAGKPLYLQVALEELRTLGTYEEIGQRIESLPGETQALFRWILQRLEADPGFRDEADVPLGKTLVSRYFAFLAVGRYGMAQRELVDLVAPGDALGNVAALQRLVRPYLVASGSYLHFFHGQFRAAVEAAYLDDEQARMQVHRQLADYFAGHADPSGGWQASPPRAISEMTYHLLQCRALSRLERLFANADFLAGFCVGVNARSAAQGQVRYDGVLELLAQLRAAIQLEALPHEGGQPSTFRALFNLLSARSSLLRGFPHMLKREICNYYPAGAFASPFDQALLDSSQPETGLQLATRPPAAEASGHSADVTALAAAPVGQLFITGAGDGSVGCWGVGEDRPRWLHHAHKGWVTCVALSPDGKWAVSTSDDGGVYLWDTDLGVRESRLILQENRIAPWHNATYCAFVDADEVIAEVMGLGYRINLRDESVIWSDKRLGTGSGSRRGRLLDYAPAARRLAVTDQNDIENTYEVVIFDVDSRAELMRIARPATLHNLALSAEGDRLFVTDRQGRSAAYEVPSGREIGSVVLERPLRRVCRAFSGPLVYGTDNSGRFIRIQLEPPLRVDASAPVTAFADPEVSSMISLADDRTLVVGHNLGRIELFDAENGRLTQTWAAGLSLLSGAIFPSGDEAIGVSGYQVAAEDRRGTGIVFVRGDGSIQTVEATPHNQSITGAAVVGSDRAFTVDTNGNAVLWERRKPIQTHPFPNAQFTACAGHQDSGMGIGATQDEQIIAWDGQQEEMFTLHSTEYAFRAGITAVAAEGSPRAVIATYNNGLVSYQREAAHWVGPEERAHTLAGSAVALDPQGVYAADGNINGELRLWRCQEAQILNHYALHEGSISALSFAPNGTTLYSAGADRCVYGIDTTTEQVIFATLLPSAAVALRAIQDGLLVLTAAAELYHFTAGHESAVDDVHSEGGLWEKLRGWFGRAQTDRKD